MAAYENDIDPITGQKKQPGNQALGITTVAGKPTYKEDPLAAVGGGVQLPSGEWVPKSVAHLYQGNAAATGTSGATGATGTSAAQTEPTSRQIVDNFLTKRLQQGTTIDKTDPTYQQQVEAFTAQQQREKANYLSEQAERLSARGMGDSGAFRQEERFASERAGQAAGAFEAQLMLRELENRRQEIKEALAGMLGLITADQQEALQRELAAIEAAIKREGLAVQSSLGQRELELRNKLGTGALNVDLLRALLQNEQFGIDAGIRIGDIEARMSPWLR